MSEYFHFSRRLIGAPDARKFKNLKAPWKRVSNDEALRAKMQACAIAGENLSARVSSAREQRILRNIEFALIDGVDFVGNLMEALF